MGRLLGFPKKAAPARERIYFSVISRMSLPPMRQSVRRICTPTTQTSSVKVRFGNTCEYAHHPIEKFLRTPTRRDDSSRAELLFIEKRAGHILHLKKSIQ